jgi:hypothetical protein
MQRTWLAVTVLAIGCAAPQPEPSASKAPPKTAGSETSPSQVAAEAEEPTGPTHAIEERGPSSFLVRAEVAGHAVAAHVRLLSASGEVVAEGESGATIDAPSGSYRVEAQVSDAATLIDKPMQTREIELVPGKRNTVALELAWAKIQLVVTVNGKPDPGAKVRLLRRGAVVAELQSGADFVGISPGRYDAEVVLKGSTIKVEGLLFPEGATQTVPVAVQL